jgi:hypothetical protein
MSRDFGISWLAGSSWIGYESIPINVSSDTIILARMHQRLACWRDVGMHSLVVCVAVTVSACTIYTTRMSFSWGIKKKEHFRRRTALLVPCLNYQKKTAVGLLWFDRQRAGAERRLHPTRPGAVAVRRPPARMSTHSTVVHVSFHTRRTPRSPCWSGGDDVTPGLFTYLFFTHRPPTDGDDTSPPTWAVMPCTETSGSVYCLALYFHVPEHFCRAERKEARRGYSCRVMPRLHSDDWRTGLG